MTENKTSSTKSSASTTPLVDKVVKDQNNEMNGEVTIISNNNVSEKEQQDEQQQENKEENKKEEEEDELDKHEISLSNVFSSPSLDSNNNDYNNNSKIYKTIFLATQYTILYYISSILLTLFIKYTTSYTNVRFPLSFLTCQMFVNFIFCGIISYFIIKNNIKKNLIENQLNNKKITKKEIFKHLFNFNSFKLLIPFGCLSGIDWGMANLSFKYITISLYTMLRSCIPVFVMIFSFIIKLEKMNWILIFSILFISIGVALTSKGSIGFQMIGFILVIGSTLFAGMRLVYAQFILQKHATSSVEYNRLENEEEEMIEAVDNENNETTTIEEKKEEIELQEEEEESSAIVTTELIHNDNNQKKLKEEEQHNKQNLEILLTKDSNEQVITSKIELSSIQVFFYTAPIIGLTVLPFALIIEGYSIITAFLNVGGLKEDSNLIAQNQSIHYLRFLFILEFIGVVFVGSFLGIILNISEFLLIKETSSLTLTVVSIVKELLLIATSVLVFKDVLSTLNIFGYSVTLIGVIVYKIHRLLELRNNSSLNNTTSTTTSPQQD
ncbi:hypothetical protein ABK040_000047 [Willaertia magna]